MGRMGRVFVGTSGYSYDHWRSLLYAGVPKRRWLERYAQVFSTVELNATFYRLPSPKAALNWRESTPAGFIFSCKGSRFLTHNKKLTDVGRGLQRFFSRVRHLGPKLAVVVWQLPPQMKTPDLRRLERFLSRLPATVRHAVEFRSAAWYHDEVCDLLDRHGAAFCEHDLVETPTPRHTGGFRYLRFHGRGARYEGRYGRDGLQPVAAALRRWRRATGGGDAYVYFNNDVHGHAVLDAAELADLLGEPVTMPSFAEAEPAGAEAH
jgi:uncharacterized protein YecE (DUF72 family)